MTVYYTERQLIDNSSVLLTLKERTEPRGVVLREPPAFTGTSAPVRITVGPQCDRTQRAPRPGPTNCPGGQPGFTQLLLTA